MNSVLNALELEAEQQTAGRSVVSPPADLPRLLYVGQPEVSMTRAGSILLYRLLQKYPAERLRIVETNLAVSDPRNRLPGVAYDTIHVASKRLLHTRLHGPYNAFVHAKTVVRPHSRGLERIAREFKPEAVLTVFDGNVWLVAAALAKRFRLPLHFISHDDWTLGYRFPRVLKSRLLRRLREVYCGAATRFCVSPNMAEDFERRFGVRGEVLYPLQGPDVPGPVLPRSGDESEDGRAFTVAYAGSIYEGYERILTLLAESLERFGGKLLIYSPHANAFHLGGAVRPNITVRAPVPADQIIRRLRAEADALCVVMSFKPEHLPAMRAAFPSKVADYTAAGLPILACGPPASSLIRWARENQGTTQVVCEESAEVMRAALERLVEDDMYRASLAAKAWKKGREFFSHDVVAAQFYEAISRKHVG